MKNTFFILLILFSYISCTSIKDLPNNKSKINQLLNRWHRDVAEFQYDDYFDKMTDDAVFVGTDASEVWSKQAFQKFSKPFFDKKKTWDFKPVSRNVYFDKDKKTAWFDELLDTWMGVCRGSGVLVHNGKEWKIKHYVLSVTVPNEDMNQVVALKAKRDSIFLQKQ